MVLRRIGRAVKRAVKKVRKIVRRRPKVTIRKVARRVLKKPTPRKIFIKKAPPILVSSFVRRRGIGVSVTIRPSRFRAATPAPFARVIQRETIIQEVPVFIDRFIQPSTQEEVLPPPQRIFTPARTISRQLDVGTVAERREARAGRRIGVGGIFRGRERF